MNNALHLFTLAFPLLAVALGASRYQTLYACCASLLSSLWLLQHAALPTTTFNLLVLDELSVWVLPFVTGLYLAIVLCIPRAERSRSSNRHLLWGLALDLAFFSVKSPAALAVLWPLTLLPLAAELKESRLQRIFVLYHGVGCVAFISGAATLAMHVHPPLWAFVAVTIGIMLRKAVIPVHQWLPELFERGPLGHTIAFCAPQVGAYATLRLLSPQAPVELLVGLGAACLVTSVYGACLACGQKSVRGAFAGLFLGQSSLVFAGLQCTTDAGLAGGLALWISGGLALTGLGLAIWALEARRGPTTLDVFSGGYERDPVLANCFLIFGLAAVGFPGTLGFVAEELLLDGSTSIHPHVGMLAAVASCLNGITVLRAYFSLFCGVRVKPQSLAGTLRGRERLALLTLVVLVLGLGLVPQLFVASRWRAAHEVLQTREQSVREAWR